MGSDESDDSDDSDDSDSSDSDEEEEPAKDNKKRKADEEPSSNQEKKPKTEDAVEGASPNLFVGNLSWNVDEEWLSSEFQGFGEISGVRIVTERETGRSRG